MSERRRLWSSPGFAPREQVVTRVGRRLALNLWLGRRVFLCSVRGYEGDVPLVVYRKALAEGCAGRRALCTENRDVRVSRCVVS